MACALVTGDGPAARQPAVPTARVSPAPRLVLPGRVDSSNPLVWTDEDGVALLTALSSWGGLPTVSRGPTLETLQLVGDATFTIHPGHGVWFESVVTDSDGRWYGFYHHERPADDCGRPDRQLPRIGAARSVDRGTTWEDLGTVLDAPPDAAACGSQNRFVLGGVGDVSAVLDHDAQDLYLYFSQYSRDPGWQGVAVARLAWADRDAPAGKVTIWQDGAWLPATWVSAGEESPELGTWRYPAGTPLVRPSRPFHDGQSSADVFWGPSIHWNTYLEQYVMLLNRAKDEQFGQDGIYVAFSPTPAHPRSWSTPARVLEGGGWYPQVAGLEVGRGSDRLAGQRARLFLTGASSHLLEFTR
jgi:hypothetical protein